MSRFLSVLATAAVLTSSLVAQQSDPEPPPQAQTPADNGSIPATLIQPVERAANYLNFYALFNGLFDSATSPAGTGNYTGVGFVAGGGISANHDFATGTFALSYRGDYHSDADPEYPGGTDQNLSLVFRKLLGKRWTFSFQENAGIYPEGTTFLEPNATTETNVLQTTPFSLDTKFTGTSIALSYAQSRRLSYEFTGTFYLMRYNSAFGYGNDSVSGSASALYRVSRDTTVSGTFMVSDFIYQHNAGNATSNTGYLTLSHNLPAHWTVGASGGVSFTSDSGTVTIPLTLKDGNLLIPVYEVGHYDQKATLPYLQGSVGRHWQHYILSISGGESTTPGDGFFLASRNLGIAGLVSYTQKRSNLSAGGYYSRLSSISVASSARISTADLQASYAYNLIRHIGSNIRYDHINYGTIGYYHGVEDNRISFGVYFTSKDLPIALF